jgi:adenylylsulfate kinase
MAENNIHPIFDRILSRTDKEKLLNQKGIVIWMTGLSGSGKSTIAIGLERKLHELGILTQVLDGDNVRTGINNNLGFSDSESIGKHSPYCRSFQIIFELRCRLYQLFC